MGWVRLGFYNFLGVYYGPRDISGRLYFLLAFCICIAVEYMAHLSSRFVTPKKIAASCSRRWLLCWLAVAFLALPLTAVTQGDDPPRPAPIILTKLLCLISFVSWSPMTIRWCGRDCGPCSFPATGWRLGVELFHPILDLTGREFEVLRGVARRQSNEEIANALGIEKPIVRSHVSTILNKLELENRTLAALYAIEMGLGRSA